MKKMKLLLSVLCLVLLIIPSYAAAGLWVFEVNVDYGTGTPAQEIGTVEFTLAGNYTFSQWADTYYGGDDVTDATGGGALGPDVGTSIWAFQPNQIFDNSLGGSPMKSGTHNVFFLNSIDDTVGISGLSPITVLGAPFPVDGFGASFSASLNQVPIPPTVLLLGAGLVGLVGIRRRVKS